MTELMGTTMILGVGGTAILMIVIMAVSMSYHNIETSHTNLTMIDNAKDCLQLKTWYKTAIDFESQFDNGGQSKKVNNHELVKAEELNCK